MGRNDAAELLGFVENVVGEGPLRVEETLGNGFVRLRVSEAERRQAKHDIRNIEDAVIELLRNARDAGAQTVFMATTREGTCRTVTCLDDGCGIPEPMLDRVFEARVTSKLDTMAMDRWGVHGRGMALFSIRHNALESRICRSEPGFGTALLTRFDCAQIAERTDQSSWPRVSKNDEGRHVTSRGPHNILRTAVDFALDCRPPEVFFGSPSDVVATIVSQGRAPSSPLPERPLPIWRDVAFAIDAPSLVARASDVGLEISERTAYRILAHEIKPLPPLRLQALRMASPTCAASREVDLERDRRSLRLSQQDLEDFSQSMERAFENLSERYYIALEGSPKVRVSHDAITVTFEIQKID